MPEPVQDQGITDEEFSTSVDNVMGKFRARADKIREGRNPHHPEKSIVQDEPEEDPAPEPTPAPTPDPTPAPTPKEEEPTEDEPEDDVPSDLLGEDSDEEEDEETGEEEEVEGEKDLPEKARDAMKSMRQQLVALKTENKELKETGVDPELQKKYDDLQARIEQVDLVNSDRFKATYNQPILAKAAQIERIVKEHEMDASGLAALRRMAPKDRTAVLARDFDHLAPTLTAMFMDLDDLGMVRAAAIKDHQTTAKTLTEQANAAAQKQRTEAFDTALEGLSSKYLPFTRSKNNEKWNETVVDATVESARKMMADKPSIPADVALAAAAADTYAELWQKEHDKRVALEESLGKRVKGTPKVGARGKPKTTPESAKRQRRSGGAVARLVSNS